MIPAILIVLYLAALVFAVQARAGRFTRIPQDSTGVEQIVRRIFGPRWQVAWCIAGYESGHNPRAISPGGGSWGLFQINTVHRGWLDWSRILDADYNTRAAYRLSRGGTYWLPWSTHARCGV